MFSCDLRKFGNYLKLYLGVTLGLKHNMSEFLIFSKTVVYSTPPYHWALPHCLHLIPSSSARVCCSPFSYCCIVNCCVEQQYLSCQAPPPPFNPPWGTLTLQIQSCPSPTSATPTTRNLWVVPYFPKGNTHNFLGWHPRTSRICCLWLSFQHHLSPAPGSSWLHFSHIQLPELPLCTNYYHPLENLDPSIWRWLIHICWQKSLYCVVALV